MRSRGDTQLLVMMQGGPGSGKSEFAKGLSVRLGAPRFSSDEMGAALFGNVNLSRAGESKEFKFNALRYAVGQVLVARQSVIVDAQHSAVSDRRRFTSLIDDFSLPTLPVIVWIQTPPDIARDRVLARPPRPDTFITSPQEIEASIARSENKLEMPIPGEYMITLSGQDPFELQISNFESQLPQLR